jgi:hypothetical protein
MPEQEREVLLVNMMTASLPFFGDLLRHEITTKQARRLFMPTSAVTACGLLSERQLKIAKPVCYTPS